MSRVQERRRHTRSALVCPAAIRDKSGKLLLRGRACDVAPCGIRVLGQGGAGLREAQDVWIELTAPNPRRSGPPTRIVKLRGQIRRISDMGEWKNVVVVIFETNFSKRFLEPG